MLSAFGLPPIPDVQSYYYEGSCALQVEPSSRTMSIQTGGHHLLFWFFRVVTIDYSLDNGVSFGNVTLKVTSKDCVSIRMSLCKALKGKTPCGGKIPRKAQKVACAVTSQPILGP